MRREFQFLVIGLFFLSFLGLPELALGANSEIVDIIATNDYYRAKVVKILEEADKEIDGQNINYQKLEVKILGGAEKGRTIIIENGSDFVIQNLQNFKVGDKIVINKLAVGEGGNEKNIHLIIDRYRLPALICLALVFLIVTTYFGRKRGLYSVVGMIFSVLIIFYYIIPRILDGADPFFTCIKGSILIILISLYLSHGFNKRTTIALFSSLVALGLAIIIDLIFVHFAKLSGGGSEEALYLVTDNHNLNLTGLLLGSIIIGVLGILDDVTTAQAATIDELHHANPELPFHELYRRGLSVGREHISSMVNTLLLAYAGISLPLIMFYSSKQNLLPSWLIINGNVIAEEIARTLVGSIVLVMAIPLTTMLATYIYSRKK